MNERSETIQSLLLDLRYAVRMLRKSPGFTAVAVLTLALGMAANTAVFSLFYQVLLHALPVPEPEQLVVLHSDRLGLPGRISTDNSETAFSYPVYVRLRDGSRSFQGVAARSGGPVQIAIDGSAERGRVKFVSGNFCQVLGLRPRAGRLIEPADDAFRGGNPVAVLSFDFWMRRFGASASAIDRKILLNSHPVVIIGVAPENFRSVLAGESPDLFVPIALKTTLTPGWNDYDRPGLHWLNVLGRLRPRISRGGA